MRLAPRRNCPSATRFCRIGLNQRQIALRRGVARVLADNLASEADALLKIGERARAVAGTQLQIGETFQREREIAPSESAAGIQRYELAANVTLKGRTRPCEVAGKRFHLRDVAPTHRQIELRRRVIRRGEGELLIEDSGSLGRRRGRR